MVQTRGGEVITYAAKMLLFWSAWDQGAWWALPLANYVYAPGSVWRAQVRMGSGRRRIRVPKSEKGANMFVGMLTNETSRKICPATMYPYCS